MSEWDAIDANYGGSDVELQRKPFTSAYMLVYVQKSRLSWFHLLSISLSLLVYPGRMIFAIIT